MRRMQGGTVASDIGWSKNTQDPSQPEAVEQRLTMDQISAAPWGSFASVQSLGDSGNIL